MLCTPLAHSALALMAPIEDQKLREALENAMRASAEWAKGVQSKKEP